MSTVSRSEQALAEVGGRIPLLGEILVRNGRITQRDLDQALGAQREIGDLIGRVLIRLGLVSESDLTAALSEQLGVPLATLDGSPPAAPRWTSVGRFQAMASCGRMVLYSIR